MPGSIFLQNNQKSVRNFLAPKNPFFSWRKQTNKQTNMEPFNIPAVNQIAAVTSLKSDKLKTHEGK